MGQQAAGQCRAAKHRSGRHRQEGQTGSQRGIAEHDLKVVGEKKKDSKHADDRERCGQTATTAIALANDSQRQQR